jgi:alkylation response protein AidB-like acyl-CoA dehydrogenase
MSEFSAPVTDISFTIDALIGMENLSDLPGHEEATPDMVQAILNEAGKFGEEILAPLNRSGDIEGCRLENGVVRTPEGFIDAYRQMAEGGWLSISADPEYGGQGLPALLSIVAFDIWNAANMGFNLVPLLSLSAIDLFEQHASKEQCEIFLPHIVAGEWAATMNLTEPQAGSDLGQLRTKAVKNSDHYLISGQKIFISGGDQDMSDNIVHLVLARTPDAPPGTRGISLFIVPKFLVNDDGSLGDRNDIRVVSIEEKLGIHGSATCVMSYGDDGGAIGYLVGEENQGLQGMFTMMNMSRTTVGVQGVGIIERAYQQAVAYAKERKQGSRRNANGKFETSAIIEHPDVKRMLLDMKIRREASRALEVYAGHCMDVSRRHADEEVRKKFDARTALLTPIVKAWATDRAIEATSLGIQVHGGLGYIEETGAAQHYRDARITAIYEGSNGIQANDLIGRKIIREQGETLFDVLREIEEFTTSAFVEQPDELMELGRQLAEAARHLKAVTDWLLQTWSENEDRVLASATKYMTLVGNVIGGWLMARMALTAHRKNSEVDSDQLFNDGKLQTAYYFGHVFLNDCDALRAGIAGASEPVTRMDQTQFV